MPTGYRGIVLVLFLAACSSETPPTSLPDAPDSLTAKAGDAKVILSWQPVAGTTGYKVLRSTTAGTEYMALAPSSKTGYTDTNVQNSTRYYYVVRSVNTVGESANSKEVTAIPFKLPSITSVTPSSGPVGVEVTIVGANYRAKQGASLVTVGGIKGEVTSWSDTSIEMSIPSVAGGNHSVVVSVNGLVSNPIAFDVIDAPMAPTNLVAASSSTDQVSLSWTDNANNEIGYVVERKIAVEDAFTVVATLDENSVSYNDTSLTELTHYYYRVYAFNAAGNSGDSNEVNAMTPVFPINLVSLNPNLGSWGASVTASGLNAGYRVIAVATGSYYTCALTGGGVKCWGRNDSGQLGDGTTTDRVKPANVSGLTSGVTAIAMGDDHTCAVTQGGGVKCWGSNSYGQLGDGTTDDRSVPTKVSGLSAGVISITAGTYHTCALTSGGGVKCWGNNDNGRLGDGTWVEHYSPTAVSGLSAGVTSIAAGRNHTCALLSVGAVKCWGNNNWGKLGDGTDTDRKTPIGVSGLNAGVIAITAGFAHTCALNSAGGMKCWGNNGYGQLGDASTTDHWSPTDVVGLSTGVIATSAGTNHTCAVTSSGGVKCWGSNDAGQIGVGSRQPAGLDPQAHPHSTPTEVTGVTIGVTAVSAGGQHTCALATGGALKCWGANYFGQLGDGNTSSFSTPVQVSGLTAGVTNIASAKYHTCALTSGGGVKCWGGFNSYDGLYGDGATFLHSMPTDVTGLTTGVTAIAAGGDHNCVVTSGGGVKCWGENTFFQLGDSTATGKAIPADVYNLATGVISIAAGANHTCALTVVGGVKCWGKNYSGQLGDGTMISRSTSTDVSGLASGVIMIAAGGDHTCALMTGGQLKCWGENEYGQLGDGSGTNRWIPTDVVSLSSDVTAIAIGDSHTCAIVLGGMKCWGVNWFGQLGDGSMNSRWTPTNVFGLGSGVTAITAGSDHSCALTSAGMKCWGANGSGELGDGSTIERFMPTTVLGLGNDLTAITAGGAHTCALTSSGALKCWGGNGIGQLGIGDTWSPIDTLAPGRVMVGGTRATVTEWNDTSVTFLVPNLLAGAYDITVEVWGVISNSLSFTVTP